MAKITDGQEKPGSAVKITVLGDVKILYSDSVIIHTNRFGLVFDFAQPVGPRQQNVVSRIGMSREHARVFAQILVRQLEKDQNKPSKTVIH
ncbi:MAG TPA: hypothetical protein VMW41_01060 [Candidatus Bathyarchaeia archaeon]|nr:hypothetical protein [Candidatus Bathyarchaeia archaeon]